MKSNKFDTVMNPGDVSMAPYDKQSPFQTGYMPQDWWSGVWDSWVRDQPSPSMFFVSKLPVVLNWRHFHQQMITHFFRGNVVIFPLFWLKSQNGLAITIFANYICLKIPSGSAGSFLLVSEWPWIAHLSCKRLGRLNAAISLGSNWKGLSDIHTCKSRMMLCLLLKNQDYDRWTRFWDFSGVLSQQLMVGTWDFSPPWKGNAILQLHDWRFFFAHGIKPPKIESIVTQRKGPIQKRQASKFSTNRIKGA